MINRGMLGVETFMVEMLSTFRREGSTNPAMYRRVLFEAQPDGRGENTQSTTSPSYNE